MDVVDKIKAVAVTTTNGMQNVPVTPVVIESVRLASQ
jgi:cyclophilin family peptidyl-prolyl cis-trans isomerase